MPAPTLSGYFYGRLEEKDAELQRLKEATEQYAEIVSGLRERARTKDALITELAAALALMDPSKPTPGIEAAIPWIQNLPGLLERAKEAVK